MQEGQRGYKVEVGIGADVARWEGRRARGGMKGGERGGGGEEV